MNKQIGAIFLVAGTCIGSGMIALPMVLAQVGLLPSIALMVVIAALNYYGALITLELNLKAGSGQPLGALARMFSGPLAELVGTVSFMAISYALFAVFISGGSSVLQDLVATLGVQYSLTTIALVYSVAIFFLLLLPMQYIDYVNRILFLALLGVFTLLIGGLVSAINWLHLPLFAESATTFSAWSLCIPVVFTSFGFQIMCHSLATYCKNDAVMLKKACFWGTLIPTVVYIIWTCSVLSVVYHDNFAFYTHMMSGGVGVGELVKQLSLIARWPLVQLLVWWIALLAIVTSVLGIGMGLCDSIKNMLRKSCVPARFHTLTSALSIVIPALIISLAVPNAFIAVMGFAGMISVVIALLLPLYLLYTVNIQRFYFSCVGNKVLLILAGVSGVIIIVCELKNIFG